MTQLPDSRGYFGPYGGRFIPETLINALNELESAYERFNRDPKSKKELFSMLEQYAGRPTPVFHARRLSEKTGLSIYFKREDLLHTGSHKLNNALGQIMLARYMGKRRIIAETGAGQHGVATATVCALFGFECVVYMGAEDIKRQEPNVKRMSLLGAEVVPVDSGSRTLKDAMNAALRDWVKNVKTTHYLLGSVGGPHPFPMMVRNFQCVIGDEAKRQFQSLVGRDPDFVVACVGGGSNAMGIFSAFVNLPGTTLIGVEAGGISDSPGQHCSTLTYGRPGILHGSLSYLLQNDDGQVMPVHSISAGLDYPGVGPEHSYFKDNGTAEYRTCTDIQAIEACLMLSRTEGIIPALESSHALGYVLNNPERFEGGRTLINLSGRGDKDLGLILDGSGVKL